MKTANHYGALVAIALASGCLANSGLVGDLPEDTDAGESTSTSAETSGGPASASGEGPTSASSSGDSGDSGDSGESGEPPAIDCSNGGLGCCIDTDGDGIPLQADNAPLYPNPVQRDTDLDGIADEVDVCPWVADPNQSDQDGDRIGDACDLCPLPGPDYNLAGNPPDYLRVRLGTIAGDIDGDGIGDNCDNCPTVPNCYDLGAGEAFDGTIPEVDGVECQADADDDGIGDACDPDLGGPANSGFELDDDFDGDGIPNGEDACARSPLPPGSQIACDGPADCPENRACSPSGQCNHLDSDGDGVGDLCDTCQQVPNPAQWMLSGRHDDPDFDGVGDACELALGFGCEERRNPRRVSYHPVSVEGSCCTAELIADEAGNLYRAETCESPDDDPSTCMPVLAPDPEFPGTFLPVRVSCEGEDCVALPVVLATLPGFLELPPGCDDALAGAGSSARENLAAAPPSAPWLSACHRPQADVDFDGIADVCDTCDFGWDPTNEPYVDETGTVWPNDGAYCNGEYLCVE